MDVSEACPPASSDQSVQPDFSKYLQEIQELELDEQAAKELLEILWSINVMFVEMGFKPDACGLLFSEFNQHSGADEPDAKLLPSATTELPSEDRRKERS